MPQFNRGDIVRLNTYESNAFSRGTEGVVTRVFRRWNNTYVTIKKDSGAKIAVPHSDLTLIQAAAVIHNPILPDGPERQAIRNRLGRTPPPPPPEFSYPYTHGHKTRIGYRVNIIPLGRTFEHKGKTVKFGGTIHFPENDDGVPSFWYNDGKAIDGNETNDLINKIPEPTKSTIYIRIFLNINANGEVQERRQFLYTNREIFNASRIPYRDYISYNYIYEGPLDVTYNPFDARTHQNLNVVPTPVHLVNEDDDDI